MAFIYKLFSAQEMWFIEKFDANLPSSDDIYLIQRHDAFKLPNPYLMHWSNSASEATPHVQVWFNLVKMWVQYLSFWHFRVKNMQKHDNNAMWLHPYDIS